VTTRPAPPIGAEEVSPECAVARAHGPANLHDQCSQTDIPLPHATGILLQARCRCACHRPQKVRK
jgi:hypothetical protein